MILCSTSLIYPSSHRRLNLCPTAFVLPGEGYTVPVKGLTLTLQRFAAQELNCNYPSLRVELRPATTMVTLAADTSLGSHFL